MTCDPKESVAIMCGVEDPHHDNEQRHRNITSPGLGKLRPFHTRENLDDSAANLAPNSKFHPLSAPHHPFPESSHRRAPKKGCLLTSFRV